MKFENREFRDEAVNLNGNHFSGCKFINCQLIFNGVGAVGLVDIQFLNCRWIFDGPASDTVAFLKALYALGDGGRDLVLRTFNDVAPDLKLVH